MTTEDRPVTAAAPAASPESGLDVERLAERDRLLQAKVREYAVALAIATQGENSAALREAEAWLARLSSEEES